MSEIYLDRGEFQNGNLKPLMSGIYERIEPNGNISPSWFDAETQQWMLGSYFRDLDQFFNVNIFNKPSPFQNLYWRSQIEIKP